MDIVGNGRHGISKRLHHVVGVALLTAMVAGSIALAIFAPFMVAVIGIVLLYDLSLMLAVEWVYEDIVDSYGIDDDDDDNDDEDVVDSYDIDKDKEGR